MTDSYLSTTFGTTSLDDFKITRFTDDDEDGRTIDDSLPIHDISSAETVKQNYISLQPTQ